MTHADAEQPDGAPRAANADVGVDDARPGRSRGALAWFAGNHVAANMIMVFLLLAGALTIFRIKVEIFPTIETNLITVTVPYLGASPSEVEEGVCVKVEEAVAGVEGVKKLTSTAAEGSGSVVVEVEEYADIDKVLDDVKNEVDRIDTFPDQTEEPIISSVTNRTQVITLAIYGDASERTLKELAERVKDDLTLSQGGGGMAAMVAGGGGEITQVDIAGVRNYEISIEVSERALRRHGLTFEQVTRTIADSSIDLPGGSIETDGGEVLVRTKGQRYVGRDFEEIVLLADADGDAVRLRDVADVHDGFEDTDLATYFDGKPAVLLNVFRIGQQDALDVAKRVKDYVANPTTHIPEQVELATWFDRSEFLEGRLALLLRNAGIGLVLVFLCLTLFLDLRLAFWTTMGIPISFLGSLWLLPVMDVSINMISLFAFIVVLGIVVDDAIVVGENIFEYRQRGYGRFEAAVRGVQEMAGPVTFAILTTIAAFMPMLFTLGEMGKILRVIPVVVIAVLLISLVEALVILPAHLTFRSRGGPRGPIAFVQGLFRAALQWFIDKPYATVLRLAVRWRYVTMAIAVATLMVTVGLIRGGVVKFRFFPPVEADNVWAALEMPQGTPLSQTRDIVKRIEAAAFAVERRLADEHPGLFQHVSTTVGSMPFSQDVGGPDARLGSAGGSHIAEINVQLLAGEKRDISAKEVARLWRERVGQVAGVSSLTFTSSLFDAGDAINLEMSHADFQTLLAATERLKGVLGQVAGVTEISDSFDPGKIEKKLALTDAGRTSGLTLADLARQVRAAYYGDEAEQVQRGRDDVKVMIRYPEADRQTLQSLENMRIRLPDGSERPLAEVASIETGRGYATIQRADRRRVVSVAADVDAAVANANEINARLRAVELPELKRDFPGLSYTFEGEQKEQAESLGSLAVNTAVALLVIFGLLGVLFRSYIQPLIVMAAIPFGFVGAVVGHLIMGFDLTLLSMFGLVALTGVVVNDSLIMIDLINRERAAGKTLAQTLLASGTRRFRPIMLTTATTFFGLMPMITEQSLQARFLIPMALSLGFGVVFATVITLLLVPSFYRILEDVKLLFTGRRLVVHDDARYDDPPPSPAPLNA